MSRRSEGPLLTDIQAAAADYAAQQIRSGRSPAEVAAELTAGGLCADQDDLANWMRRANEISRTETHPHQPSDDPSGFEKQLQDAAQSIPGASELLGLGRFGDQLCELDNEAAAAGQADFVAREVVARTLDFLVPELLYAGTKRIRTTTSIPNGGGYTVLGQTGKTLGSAVAINNARGEMVRLLMHTRPRGKPRRVRRSTILPIHTVTIIMHADPGGIIRRLIQAALEMRPGRHGRMMQIELAPLLGVTKQAVSNQRLEFLGRVTESSQGRAGWRGIRNVRRR